jgi:hypothetical protein
MAEFQKASTTSSATTTTGGPTMFPCTGDYQLKGPQVEPGASHWLECLNLRMITKSELTTAVGDPPKYWVDAGNQTREIQELIEMARLRDEPGMIGHMPCMAEDKEAQRDRATLSLFLDLRPQPFGAVVNTARGMQSPVIASGRELARYFESETPGLSFQLALNFIISQTPGFSPPRQAAIWAGLHVTIASALSAAWFYKWRGGAGVQYRKRPQECYPTLDVLFDRVPNSTDSADGPRRGFPFGTQPAGPQTGVVETPERQVKDVKPLGPSLDTPGTPRHPAYPSGHSTYSASAARYLGRFFPKWKEELDKMADNIGMARLWAAVHWRSDHTFGRTVGSAVADLVIKQMVDSKIFELSLPADPKSDIAPPRLPPLDPTKVPNPCTDPNPGTPCKP